MIRLLRSPEGADSAGATVLEAPETAPVENTSPETEAAEAPAEKTEVEKPKASDWEKYQKMQEKFERNPNAKVTKGELELQKKYEGKDESKIQGYKAKEQQAEESAPELPAEKPKENPLHKLVGAKSDAELMPKVQELVKTIERHNGERGEVGRVLQAMEAKSPQEALTFVKGAKALHNLVQDLKAGKAEAFAYLGIKPQQAQEFTGELPKDILDEGLYKHISPQLKAQTERADRLERMVQELTGKIQPWEQSQQQTAAQNARNAQVTAVVSEFSALADNNEGLWDSKRSGSLSKALTEYYHSAPDAPYNPALKPIVEIIDLAKKHGIQDPEVALAYWERKNGGSLIARAREDARQPFIGKKPSVGLSDQQGNHNGQFKSFTEAHVKDMNAGKIPIPREWTDRDGTLIPDKIPAHLRALVLGE